MQEVRERQGANTIKGEKVVKDLFYEVGELLEKLNIKFEFADAFYLRELIDNAESINNIELRDKVRNFLANELERLGKKKICKKQ
jgi:hypothetical protein